MKNAVFAPLAWMQAVEAARGLAEALGFLRVGRHGLLALSLQHDEVPMPGGEHVRKAAGMLDEIRTGDRHRLEEVILGIPGIRCERQLAQVPVQAVVVVAEAVADEEDALRRVDVRDLRRGGEREGQGEEDCGERSAHGSERKVGGTPR
jgi:hypothetical protein